MIINTMKNTKIIGKKAIPARTRPTVFNIRGFQWLTVRSRSQSRGKTLDCSLNHEFVDVPCGWEKGSGLFMVHQQERQQFILGDIVSPRIHSKQRSLGYGTGIVLLSKKFPAAVNHSQTKGSEPRQAQAAVRDYRRLIRGEGSVKFAI